MRPGSGFLIAGIVIFLIGIVWLIVGGTGSAPLTQGFGLAQTPPQIPDTPAADPAAGTPPLTQTPEPSLLPSTDAVRLHLIDISFGEGNVNLQRWDPATNNGRIIISVNGGSSSDIRNLEDVARQFNSISATNKISENIKQNSQADITIKFVPESGMSAIALNTSGGGLHNEVFIDGITAARISPGSIYLNANLKGDVRNHTLIRSLFYTLGAVGESDIYPDSLFYSGENTNMDLTYIDQKALELLFGKRLQPGMSASEVKEILYVK